MIGETGDSNLPMNFVAMVTSAVMKSVATTSAMAMRIWTASTAAIVTKIAMVSAPGPVTDAAAQL
jgi:hypothetical protein